VSWWRCFHFNLMPAAVQESACGPRLTTWALQRVVSFLGYTGRAANVAATAESDPERKPATVRGLISDGIGARAAFTPEISANMLAPTRYRSLTMIRFMFLVLERHRVVAPTSARPSALPVPAL
jgi:hypothetical protein